MMKKILILLFLFAPICANAQYWFKVNAVRFAVDHEFRFNADYEYSEWQKTNIDVFMAEDNSKVNIYAEETQTIRRTVKHADTYLDDESGDYNVFWRGVDEKGKDFIVCKKSDLSTYMHLIVIFIEDNFIICYNLIPDM